LAIGLTATAGLWTVIRRPADAEGLALLAVVGVLVVGGALVFRSVPAIGAGIGCLGLGFVLGGVERPVTVAQAAAFGVLAYIAFEFAASSIDEASSSVRERIVVRSSRAAIASVGVAGLGLAVVAGAVAVAARQAVAGVFVAGTLAGVLLLVILTWTAIEAGRR
jgi:hypothetical protein